MELNVLSNAQSLLGDYVSENLYAPPKSQVSDSPPTPLNQRHFYTPWQICVAAIIAGPIGGGYFFYRNYQYFGNRRKATSAFLISGILLVVLTGLGLIMRKGESGTGLAAIVAGLYRWYANDEFGAEVLARRAAGRPPASWWLVIGLSIVMLICSLFFAAAVYLMSRSMVLSLPT